MKIAHVTLTKGTIWTIMSFGGSQFFRLSTNIILTRLLAPQLFGIMVIVNALNTGVELISDVGIGQNIIYNKNGDEPTFANTAWTLQSLRGVLLWVIACIFAGPVARYYETPILLIIIPIASFVLVLSGFSSVNRFLVQRRMQFARLAIYEIIVGATSAIAQVALAYFFPTIWALVFGVVLAAAIGLIGSFFLLPDVTCKFKIATHYAWEILHFGKWIFFGSVVYYFSISLDRLYLAGVVPLALLGVYGIARSISELLSILVLRIGNIVIFPFVASHSQTSRVALREQLVAIRLSFLLVAAIGFSFSAATIDLAIKIVLDQRYHAATWMVPVLIMGAWISILCSLNESTLLGIGKPRYGAIGYSLKFIWLLIGLPFSFNHFGVLGSIIVVAISDIFRYVSIVAGQLRERLTFGKQDFFVTLLMVTLVAIIEWIRWTFGFGTSFENLPFFG